ncbi:MAG TPA: transcription elongation factor GreB [Glaciecola sp.]|jgi:transcription elongation factor GreB|nr:transcription elongation factor GreB [Glaciecola sp.]
MINKANLITPNGYRLLQEEEDYLWRIERPEITQKVTWAAGLGDRSDNADYQMNKSRLRRIHSRVRFIRKRLESVKVISPSKEQIGKVFFGAWVTLEEESGVLSKVQIVGSDEIYKHAAPCSIDSPLARAMLGKVVDDEVLVNTPSGTKYYYLTEIEYDFD